LLLKTVSRCRTTLQGEGHSVAGWGMGGSVWLQTAGLKTFIRAPHSVIDSQYATLNCKLLLVRISL